MLRVGGVIEARRRLRREAGLPPGGAMMAELIEGRTGDWEVVIGLEVHAQVIVAARSCSPAPPPHFGAEPNTQVSTVDAAFPGMLPVINRALRRAGGEDRARP